MGKGEMRKYRENCRSGKRESEREREEEGEEEEREISLIT